MKCRSLPTMILLALLGTLSARGHETDQWTLPAREFADMGEAFTRWAHRIISKSMDEINEEVRNAIAMKHSAEAIADLQDPDRLVNRVNGQIPWALDIIENLEKRIHGAGASHKYAGRLTGHKDIFSNVYTMTSLPFDPRQLVRMFYSSSIKAYGVHFGTDKVGHFTDMGMNYWRDYRRARRSGKGHEEALRAAVSTGQYNPILSENGFLGMVTAGSYSNADLVSNYSGMLFYLNLTEPMMIKGRLRPPMVVREGPFWKLSDHVRADGDFFEMFISEHWDESLNPSVYDITMRDGFRRNVRKYASTILERHADANGNRRPRAWFEARYEELSTYWGAPYGKVGHAPDQITIFNSCFETHPEDSAPTARNRFGETPLHQAAQRGHINRVKNLIARGAKVDERVVSDERMNSDWGNTALHYAAAGGHLDVVEALLAAGADADAANVRGATPLHRSICQARVMERLIAAGAKVGAKDARGGTALHWAAREPDADTVWLLLKHGAAAGEADIDSRTPLHVAATTGNVAAVNALVEGGADVRARDASGATPLHLAAGRRSVEAFEALLVADADLKVVDGLGRTPLHVAAKQGTPEIVRLILDAGGDARLADAFGNQPLHAAARRGRVEVGRMLVERGADANVLNLAGYAPIHEAAHASVPELVRFMVAHGAKGDLRSPRGVTPLDLASQSSRVDLEPLLRNGRVRTIAASDYR